MTQKNNMEKQKFSIRRFLTAALGILSVGIGVAFNASAKLGNDPVGIFYDGIRNVLHLTEGQLGTASNLVNVALAVILFFTGKRYLNIGTLIYVLPYGGCVYIGTALYPLLFRSESLLCRGLGSLIGCLLLYTGVALFITADIGLDPMTGIAMMLKDRLHWDFKKAKWLLDGCLTLGGFWLGGKPGVVTALTAIAAGPVIQGITKLIAS